VIGRPVAPETVAAAVAVLEEVLKAVGLGMVVLRLDSYCCSQAKGVVASGCSLEDRF
jgi:hypothetical protein